jgi:chromosome segregation ATPase
MTGIKTVLIPVTLAGLALGGFANALYNNENVSHNTLIVRSERGTQAPIIPASTRAPSPARDTLLRVRDHIKEVEEKHAFLQEKGELLANLLESRDKELAALSADHKMLKEESTKKIDELNGLLVKKEGEMGSLGAKKTELEAQVKELSDRVQVLFDSQAAFQGQISALQQEKIALSQESDKLSQEMQNQKAINETLKSAIDGLNQSLEKREQERLALVQELEKAAQEKNSRDNQLNELKVAQIENSAEKQELERRLKELQGFYDEEKNSVLKAAEGFSQKSAQVSEKESRIASLTQQLEEVQKVKQALRATLDEKENALVQLRGRLGEQEAQLQALENEATAGKGRYAQLEQRFDSLARDKEKGVASLQSDLGSREARLREMAVDLEKARAKELQMEQRLNEQASLNDSLQGANKELAAELELLRAEILSNQEYE